MKDWIQCRSGRKFYPFSPRIDDIDPFDIGWHTSNECRFTGATSAFYSVAQHSLLVALILPPHLQAHGLLHDASEAYLKDIASPVKYLPEMAGYREAEDRLQRMIFRRFGLDEEMPPEVKAADRRALWTEANQRMVPLHEDWTSEFKEACGGALPEKIGVNLSLWDPREAFGAWIAKFNELRFMGRLAP